MHPLLPPETPQSTQVIQLPPSIGSAFRRSLKTIPRRNRYSDVYLVRLSMLSCLGIRRIGVVEASRGQVVVANTCRCWATAVVQVAASQVRVGGISLRPSE